jgi:hypothetical protein
MATVRMTQMLRDRIDSRIRTKFDDQETMLRETLSPTFGDRVYEYSLRKYIEAMKSLPESFFPRATMINTTLKHYELPNLLANLRLTTERAIPFTVNKVYSETLICENSALYDEYNAMYQKVINVKKEQQNVRDAIRKALTQSSTLKRFLTIMPEAEMFVPSDELQKHYAAAAKPIPKPIVKQPEGLSKEQRVTLAKIKMSGL